MHIEMKIIDRKAVKKRSDVGADGATGGPRTVI